MRNLSCTMLGNIPANCENSSAHDATNSDAPGALGPITTAAVHNMSYTMTDLLINIAGKHEIIIQQIGGAFGRGDTGEVFHLAFTLTSALQAKEWTPPRDPTMPSLRFRRRTSFQQPCRSSSASGCYCKGGSKLRHERAQGREGFRDLIPCPCAVRPTTSKF